MISITSFHTTVPLDCSVIPSPIPFGCAPQRDSVSKISRFSPLFGKVVDCGNRGCLIVNNHGGPERPKFCLRKTKKQTFKETNVQRNKRSKEQTFKGTNLQRNKRSKKLNI